MTAVVVFLVRGNVFEVKSIKFYRDQMGVLSAIKKRDSKMLDINFELNKTSESLLIYSNVSKSSKYNLNCIVYVLAELPKSLNIFSIGKVEYK